MTSTINQYDVGDRVRCSVTFTDANGHVWFGLGEPYSLMGH